MPELTSETIAEATPDERTPQMRAKQIRRWLVRAGKVVSDARVAGVTIGGGSPSAHDVPRDVFDAFPEDEREWRLDVEGKPARTYWSKEVGGGFSIYCNEPPTEATPRRVASGVLVHMSAPDRHEDFVPGGDGATENEGLL